MVQGSLYRYVDYYPSSPAVLSGRLGKGLPQLDRVAAIDMQSMIVAVTLNRTLPCFALKRLTEKELSDLSGL
jgi:hypothetical protein